MKELLDFIVGLGVPAVLFAIYAESGLLIGFFFPGDSLLFTSGFLVQQNILHIDIFLFAFLLFITAALGESTGYLFGKKVGRRLFMRENTRFFRKDNLIRAEKFYEKYGAAAIILACFVPIIRTFVPIVAGVSKMNYKQFIPFNLIGSFSWTMSFTLLGFYAGKFLNDHGVNVETAALVIIFLSISPMLYHLLNTREKRANLWAGTKRELSIVFGNRKR